MTYNSISFVIFFLCFLGIYLLMPKNWMRQGIILIGNLIFYLCTGGLNYLIIVVGTSLVVYATAWFMDRVYRDYDEKKQGLTPKEQVPLMAGYKKKCRKYLYAGMILVLGILVYIKVGKLMGWEEVSTLSQFGIRTVLVPLGISYYTFSSVGYMLDIYWRKVKCERNYVKLFLCITYFPIIIQGPISRYDRLMKQFDELPGFSYERVCHGMQLMLWGYFKKMVVADRLALFNTTVFGDISSFAGAEVFLAILGNVIALYADFSGCMDIVCGVAQAMGITLDQNFKQPFFSQNVAEFWRRWHITLGTWFKDYVYMPIAMNPGFMKFGIQIRKKYGMRAGQIVSSAVPLAVVWLLTGLWHGTGVDYIAWGFYWGMLILLGTVLAPEFKKMTDFLRIDTETFGFRLFRMARTFVLFCIGRMLTATGSLKGFFRIIRQLVSGAGLWMLFDGSIYEYGLDQKNFTVALLGILLMLLVDILHEKYHIREELSKQPLLLRWIVYYGAVAVVLVLGMYGAGYDVSSFAYGAF